MFLKTRVRSEPELRILAVLVLNDHRLFTAKELSVKANVHLSKIYRIIKQLEKEGEVKHCYIKGDNGKPNKAVSHERKVVRA